MLTIYLISYKKLNNIGIKLIKNIKRIYCQSTLFFRNLVKVIFFIKRLLFIIYNKIRLKTLVIL